MNNLLQLDISPVSLNINAVGNNKTPGDIGNSLFQDLLSKIEGSSGEEAWGASLFRSENSLTKGFNKSCDTGTLPGTVQKLEKKLRDVGLKSSQLFLTDSALPQLIAFLESKGFSTEKINQILLSAKDTDGLLQLDKLFAQLAKTETGNITDNRGPVVQAADIPQTQELLFKMGLGTGEIKKVIEKSVNQNGEISIAGLSAALKKHSPDSTSGSKLLALLEHNGINVKTSIIDKENMDSDLKKQFANLLENPSQDTQKTIKQNIAALLREKGMQPQEVKSFLENINIEVSKSVLKGGASLKQEENIPLNQVVMKDQSAWQKGTWNEKVLGILKNERLLIGDDAGKGLFQDQGEIKLNLSELLKQGDQKVKSEILFGMNEAKTSSKPVKTDTSAENSGRGSQAGNALGNDFTLQKEQKVAASMNQTKEAYNLPQPLPKILDRMIWMIRAGEQSGRIFINPPELGRLDLDLTLKNGHLHANLSAESIMVKEIIESNLNQLKQQLTDQGLTVDKFEVMVGLGDKESEKEDMWAGQGRKGSSSKKGPRASEEDSQRIGDRPAGKSLVNLYQIDVQV